MRYLWNYIRTWFIIRKKRFQRLSDSSKGEEYTKFAILCAPRSGSTLLHTYLNSHHHILSHGELIRRKIERGDELHSVYEYAYIPQAKTIKAVGLKLFYEYQNRDDFKAPFEEVMQDKEIKIVHLIRMDKRKQLTSLKKAEKSGVWSTTLKSEKEVDVSITDDEVETYAREQAALIEASKKLFHEHEVLEVSYEDLVNNPRDTLTAIQKFIGVEPRPLFTLLKKQGEE